MNNLSLSCSNRKTLTLVLNNIMRGYVKVRKGGTHDESWPLQALSFIHSFNDSFIQICIQQIYIECLSESESRSVMFDCLRPHGLYSPWNSPGQNTGVGSLSLLQGIFPTQGSNPGLPQWRRILSQLSHREAQEYWSE